MSMEELDALRKRLKALEVEGADPKRTREHARLLREGLDRLSERVAALQQERDDLHARRESLETQVMDMIGELEAEESMWDNVLYLFSDDEDFDPGGGDAA